MGNLREVSETVAQILDGNHDAHLGEIVQAAQWRKKHVFRRGAKFILKGTKNTNLEGKTATVIKVNSARITVGVGDPVEEYGFKTWADGEYNVPPTMLVAV